MAQSGSGSIINELQVREKKPTEVQTGKHVTVYWVEEANTVVCNLGIVEEVSKDISKSIREKWQKGT